MPVEKNTITGNATLGVRALYCKQGIQMYLKSNGRMQLTRMATPAVLGSIATEFTGVTYARSRKGMEKALADLNKLFAAKEAQEGSVLDAVGETAVVNKVVGGVAADLMPEKCGFCGGTGEVKKYAHAESGFTRQCPYCRGGKR